MYLSVPLPHAMERQLSKFYKHTFYFTLDLVTGSKTVTMYFSCDLKNCNTFSKQFNKFDRYLTSILQWTTFIVHICFVKIT